MSVITKLLFLAIYLSILADGALNKKNSEKFRFLSQVRPRDISPNPTQDTPYPCLTASGNSRALPSSDFATGSGRFLMPSGTANIGSSFGIVPYPTEGAPYRNSTSSYTEQSNGDRGNGQSGSGDQCQSQQTVTLPPQTITLPVQTVTITPSPETITITPLAQTETVTITLTPQIQTTTVTVWMTVTESQAPSCPSPGNIANPQTAPVPPPNAQPSNTPVAPVFNNASTPPIVPPIVTTPIIVVPMSTVDTVPIASGILPVVPDLGPTTTTEPITFPENDQTSLVAQHTSSPLVLPVTTSIPIKAPYPYRNITNQTLILCSGSSRGFRPIGSGFAKPTNRNLGNVSTLLTPPSQANLTAFRPTAGPTAPPSPTKEYFPDDGSTLLTPPAEANATISPTIEYFPDDGSSLLVPPAQANATSVLPMGGPTAPIITTGPPPPMIQLNTSTSSPPISAPIPPSTSIFSTPQPLTNSTPPLCTNGTTAKNITTNVRFLPPNFSHSLHTYTQTSRSPH